MFVCSLLVKKSRSQMFQWCVSAIFRLIAISFGILTLQGKYNIYTLSKNINSFALDAKQCRKVCQRIAFLPVSLARINELYIFRQCTCIIPITGHMIAHIWVHLSTTRRMCFKSSKSKDWLDKNQDNVSEWSVMQKYNWVT